MPHYADKLIKNIKKQANLSSNISANYNYDKKFIEYKKKLEFIGLQENEINFDKTIDFHVLYMYE